MRALIQRVTRARVTVDDEVVGEINRPGLCVLVGVTHHDTDTQIKQIARKIAGLRLLREEKSVTDEDAAVLVISQFTLYGDARKGRRPTWNQAASGEVAEPAVAELVRILREEYSLEVATGRFGADMRVELVNDGPVTLMIEA